MEAHPMYGAPAARRAGRASRLAGAGPVQAGRESDASQGGRDASSPPSA
ncbi:MAG TPA: hypothetical protein VFS95_13160 [Telluria sp.]|nr:hypothetical protein [Telluria sp.]